MSAAMSDSDDNAPLQHLRSKSAPAITPRSARARNRKISTAEQNMESPESDEKQSVSEQSCHCSARKEIWISSRESKSLQQATQILRLVAGLLAIAVAVIIEWENTGVFSRINTEACRATLWEEFRKEPNIPRNNLTVIIVGQQTKSRWIWNTLIYFEGKWVLYTPQNNLRDLQETHDQYATVIRTPGQIFSFPYVDNTEYHIPLIALAIAEEVLRTFGRRDVISTIPIMVHKIEAALMGACCGPCLKDNVGKPKPKIFPLSIKNKYKLSTNLLHIQTTIQSTKLIGGHWEKSIGYTVTAEQWWKCVLLQECPLLNDKLFVVRDADIPVEKTLHEQMMFEIAAAASMPRIKQSRNAQKQDKIQKPDRSRRFTAESIQIDGMLLSLTEPLRPVLATDARLNTYWKAFGFVIMRFATGETLDKIRSTIEELWEPRAKEAIHNGVIGDPEREDLGRLQAHIPDELHLPIEELIVSAFPTSTGINLGLKVILANFLDARAQKLHFDHPVHAGGQADPKDGMSIVHTSNGGAIVALHTTSIFLCPGSHRVNSGEIFSLYEAVIPEGCVLLFSNIAHAGYGIWCEKDAVFVPCPRRDDCLNLQTHTLEKRIHFHVEQGGQKTLYDQTVFALDHFPQYFDINFEKQPTKIFPHVFIPHDRLAGGIPIGQDRNQLQDLTLVWNKTSTPSSVGAVCRASMNLVNPLNVGQTSQTVKKNPAQKIQRQPLERRPSMLRPSSTKVGQGSSKRRRSGSYDLPRPRSRSLPREHFPHRHRDRSVEKIHGRHHHTPSPPRTPHNVRNIQEICRLLWTWSSERDSILTALHETLRIKQDKEVWLQSCVQAHWDLGHHNTDQFLTMSNTTICKEFWPNIINPRRQKNLQVTCNLPPERDLAPGTSLVVSQKSDQKIRYGIIHVLNDGQRVGVSPIQKRPVMTQLRILASWVDRDSFQQWRSRLQTVDSTRQNKRRRRNRGGAYHHSHKDTSQPDDREDESKVCLCCLRARNVACRRKKPTHNRCQEIESPKRG